MLAYADDIDINERTKRHVTAAKLRRYYREVKISDELDPRLQWATKLLNLIPPLSENMIQPGNPAKNYF